MSKYVVFDGSAAVPALPLVKGKVMKSVKQLMVGWCWGGAGRARVDLRFNSAHETEM